MSEPEVAFVEEPETVDPRFYTDILEIKLTPAQASMLCFAAASLLGLVDVVAEGELGPGMTYGATELGQESLADALSVLADQIDVIEDYIK